jgi:hypothetical protein
MISRILMVCFLAGAVAAHGDAPTFARAYPSVVEVRAITAGGVYNQGSGVVIAPGVIATNAHVLRGGFRVSITKDGRTWEVDALCVSPDQDLVLLKVPGLFLPPVEIAPEASLETGMSLVSLGYPGGHGPLPKRGRLVAFWNWKGGHLIQSDAAISPGSSGGGFFTEDGRLVGISTFFISANQKAAFAIPGEWVASLAQGGPAPAGFQCPFMVPENLVRDFQDLIAEDPQNRSNWNELTRQWVAEAPQDPEAWFARATAMDLALEAHPRDAASLQAVTATYRRTVALNPRLPKAWNNLGAALDVQNQFQAAQEAFRKALALKPDYAMAWLNLGASLMNSGILPEAVSSFQRGLVLKPDDVQGWARLAYCEAGMKRWKEAADHYKVALRFAPFRADWWGERYLACRQTNQEAEAQEALDHVRSLSPALAQHLR